ncbi:MAG: hypothetical protein JO002_16930 [Burkholderiaceae bacterium]|nr:hypothetical protein [Burkholderiaceae bacterium]
MHSDKVYVTPTAEGAWLVRTGSHQREDPAVFKSKIDAIEEALSRTSEEHLVIYSAEGRLMRRIDVPTSVPKEQILRAILKVAREAGR